MSDPATREDFDALFKANTRITGFGLATTMNYPCPFCAAAGWAAIPILETEEQLAKDRTCASCGRGCKTIFTHNGPATLMKVVQTAGPDIPSYLPAVERVQG